MHIVIMVTTMAVLMVGGAFLFAKLYFEDVNVTLARQAREAREGPLPPPCELASGSRLPTSRTGLIIGRTLMVVGIGGFTAGIWVPALPRVLSHIELPHSAPSMTLVAPDGRLFVASAPLARVQRYSRDGVFEAGWPIATAGGQIDIGMDRSGNIAVCAARLRALHIYTPDGVTLRDAGPCRRSSQIGSSGYLPADETIAPQRSAPNPKIGALALIMVRFGTR